MIPFTMRTDSSHAAIHRQLRSLGSPRKARLLRGFFKTGPGEYGEGDVFLGATVPEIRRLAEEHGQIPLSGIRSLLHSPIHESRLLALIILVDQYEGNGDGRKRIFDFYLRSTRHINNWDLVDCSAPQIVGVHLSGKQARLLDRLARSSDLWKRRIAIVATLHFIRQGRLRDTFRLARTLLDDPEDLIHKATGWMLREAGKRNQRSLERFLRAHARRMPRTMLRYAIERLSERKRRGFLSLKPRR